MTVKDFYAAWAGLHQASDRLSEAMDALTDPTERLLDVPQLVRVGDAVFRRLAALPCASREDAALMLRAAIDRGLFNPEEIEDHICAGEAASIAVLLAKVLAWLEAEPEQPDPAA